MEFVTGLKDSKVKTLEELEREESVGTEVTAEGMVHSIRDMEKKKEKGKEAVI